MTVPDAASRLREALTFQRRAATASRSARNVLDPAMDDSMTMVPPTLAERRAAALHNQEWAAHNYRLARQSYRLGTGVGR
jgi:hypothetical protein